MKHLATLSFALSMLTGGALAADPIEGTWRMPSGNDARIAACSGGFCLTYVNGPNKGKTFGQMKPSGGGNYEGTVTDYTKGGKEYSGKGKLTGDTLSVSGCVLGGLICRSQALTRL
ncbi:DUF2147 domain-containing protein [Aureimonas sp. ME7]|uniref:DUF2147 domain-containing protein n=1 Tax=Aureimonas sp. ME7 TaxID=2744252 RepID=UPI0015F3B894|nr:DUF2147 domain-containing protein [Aureimonas sp. ME7]